MSNLLDLWSDSQPNYNKTVEHILDECPAYEVDIVKVPNNGIQGVFG